MRVLHLEVLPVLQLCAANGPLFPNLKSLDFWPGTGEPVPFIPLFLSAGLTSINMVLFGSDNYGVTVVSLIAALPALCPNLQRITLQSLPRDGTVTAAVSGMLLASSRNALQYIRVDSPLTVEAYEVICQLPSLRKLWVIVEGDVSLPSAVLPNLTKLMIQHDGGSGWSQMFRGATLEKLDSIKFHSGLKQPQEDFLETFERVALSISAQNTLSKFSHYKSRSWNPNYSCLLPFTQLTHLVIEHPCNDVCSSTVDDEVVTNLARAMPRLETLQLGDSPCSEIITGATVKGLVALAYHCLDLSTLRIHFKVDSFRALPVDAGMAPEHESTVRRRECALKELDIGYTFVSEESALVVALTLLRIFPHVQCTGWGGDGWDQVVDAINGSRQLVHYSSERLPARYASGQL